MIDYSDFFSSIENTPLAQWRESLPPMLAERQDANRHGDIARWLDVLARLPDLKSSTFDLKNGVTIGARDECSGERRNEIEGLLRELHPWRKGPFRVHNIHIDTEWRSDWKWERVLLHIQPLEGKRVLDVGCGSGYHCWRMAGEGACLVVGIDPGMLFNVQFQAIRHFMAKPPPVFMLPLRLEEMPELMPVFDTVFSMGVLYHRRSPMDHLAELRACLNSGGELVLETLVIDGGEGETLVPQGRYAKMGNVWSIPSPPVMQQWLGQAGFEDIRCVDINQTSVQEQRRTDWMTFESLDDFLDPAHKNMTVEGYPRPKRAIFVAKCP